MDDTISRQAAIDRINKQREHLQPDIYPQDEIGDAAYRICAEFIERLPSAQPEIIRCNSCKHWTQSTEKMKGYGLGRCDFHDVDLVTCNGFCYWAERRTDD